MSTLDEIEAAADRLPPEQQQLLVAHLSARLENAVKSRAMPAKSSLEQSLRGFPVSKGRVSFTSQDVARIEAEVDVSRQ